MGVPKFFRWISERYPCLSETVREHEIPEFDNLYLDMNGIIHPCSHPEDDNIHFRMSEEQMFKNVMNYVDFIFRMIKPKKVFFMAVDGVAPRAKMNQQRSRRFRSAKEAETQEARALRKGETLPSESRFDSNCITPGTPFMARLQAALTEFAQRKVAEDPLWRGIRVVLSGHQTPGEGEHKIMEFIRYERSLPDYDPNTRHCLYGLDADLIMLGLASHQAHFSLLREEVRFGGKKDKKSHGKASAPETITFFLLHLSLLRDYIDIEFRSIRADLKFGYDLERIIDDWVLLGFLVGNDFLPHLPDLHIHAEALPLLWNTYKKVLPTLDGYLQCNGEIALERLQSYFATLAQFDDDSLREKCSDMRWMKGRQGERMARELERLGQPPDLLDNLMAAEGSSGGEAGVGESDEDSEDDFLADEMQMMKQEYYQGKMGLLYDETERRRQTREYVRGLQWVLYYYYRGVPSWGWFYPQHYAPYISDVRDFAELDLQFDLGHPFLPFQQLMAVLPAASGILLPDCLRPLMESPNSPVRQFYPAEFESDLNGKKQDWEAVVLIPFIDEEELLAAMRPQLAQLTDEERARNCFRPHLLFEWDPAGRRCKQTEIEPFGFRIGADKLAPPVCRAAHLPGFPVLRGLPFSAELRKAGVKVFQFASRGENTVLTLTDCKFDEARVQRAAAALLDKTALADWPHLSEVHAVAISSATRRYTRRPDGAVQCEELSESDAAAVLNEWELVRRESMARFGISVSNETPCVLTAKTLLGRVLDFGRDGAAQKRSQFSQGVQPFVLQRCLPEPTPEAGPALRIEDVLPIGELVFVASGNWYGMSGPVLGFKPQARVQVQLRVRRQPDLSVVDSEDRFLSAQALAQRTGFSGHLVSRLTGTVLVSLPKKAPDLDADASSSATDSRNRRLNIGLELKFNRAGQEVAGWTRKDASMGWQYSPALAQVLLDYASEFPELFRCLATKGGSDSADLSSEQIWGSAEPPVERLTEFLRSLPCFGAERVPVGSSILSGRSVSLIRQALDSQLPNLPKPDVSAIEFRADNLYRCQADTRHCLPDPSAVHRLKDRVVVCRPGSGPPLDSLGTIIGIRACVRDSDPELELLLDEPFDGSVSIRGVDGCCLVSGTAVLNLSHGERTNSNNRYTAACQDRPDQHVQLWTDLQQHKNQQQQSRNMQQQKQMPHQLERNQQWQRQQQQQHQRQQHQQQQQQQQQQHQQQQQQQQHQQQQQQQKQQQEGSFNFSALVSALQHQQQPAQSSAPPPPPPPHILVAEQESQRLLDSLLTEWNWPAPAIDYQVYGPVCSAVVRFRNGFVMEGQPMRSRAEAKLDVVHELCKYCDSLKVPQEQQQQQHQRQRSQHQQQQCSKPQSNYSYQAAPAQQQRQQRQKPQQQQQQQGAKAQEVEMALRAMLQIPTPAQPATASGGAAAAPAPAAAAAAASTTPKQQQQQKQPKSHSNGSKQPKSASKKRLGINLNGLSSQQQPGS